MRKSYKIWKAKENTVFDGLLKEGQETKDIVILEGDNAIVKPYDKNNVLVILENINDADKRFNEGNEQYTLIMGNELFNEKFFESSEKELLQEPESDTEIEEDDSEADVELTSGDYVETDDGDEVKVTEEGEETAEFDIEKDKIEEKISKLKSLYFEACTNPHKFEEEDEELEKVKEEIKDEIEDLEKEVEEGATDALIKGGTKVISALAKNPGKAAIGAAALGAYGSKKIYNKVKEDEEEVEEGLGKAVIGLGKFSKVAGKEIAKYATKNPIKTAAAAGLGLGLSGKSKKNEETEDEKEVEEGAIGTAVKVGAGLVGGALIGKAARGPAKLGYKATKGTAKLGYKATKGTAKAVFDSEEEVDTEIEKIEEQISNLKALYFEAETNPGNFEETPDELEKVKEEISDKVNDLENELEEAQKVKNTIGDDITLSTGDSVEVLINEKDDKLIFDTIKEATEIIDTLDKNLFPAKVKEHLISVFDKAISTKVTSISEKYIDALNLKAKQIEELKEQELQNFIKEERKNIKSYMNYVVEELTDKFKVNFVNNKLVEQAEKNHKELSFVMEKLSRDYNIDMSKNRRNATLETELSKLKEEVERQRLNNITLIKHNLVRDITEEMSNEIIKNKVEKLSENIEFVNAEDYYNKVKLLSENLTIESKTERSPKRRLIEEVIVDSGDGVKEKKITSNLDLYKGLY